MYRNKINFKFVTPQGKIKFVTYKMKLKFVSYNIN